MKVTANGIDINYEIEGEGPVVTFSHSLACNLSMWDEQVRALESRYRVLRYDTRGHGQTAAPKGQYTLEGLADDLRALLQHLKIEKPHFVGLSMGGMIGQVVTLTDPGLFDRVVLADTGHAQTPETRKQWQERIQTAETKGMQPLVQPTIER